MVRRARYILSFLARILNCSIVNILAAIAVLSEMTSEHAIMVYLYSKRNKKIEIKII